MNKPTINMIRTCLARIVSSALILCAAALAVSAQMTQTSKKEPKPDCIWPPLEHKDEIKKAIETALDNSATDQGFRDKLLDCTPEKCDTPKKEVRKLLDQMYPNLHIADFPKRVVIVFYQPETYLSEAELTKYQGKFSNPADPLYPTNSCYSVFHLPQYTGKAAAPTANMGNHL